MQDRTGIKWNEDETTLALYLYYLIESGQVDNRSKAINNLALYLGRTPGSVEMKIGNIQFCDMKNTKGLKNGGKTDEMVFQKYLLHPNTLDLDVKRIIGNSPDVYVIEDLIEKNPFFRKASNENTVMEEKNYLGTETIRMISARNEQSSFRNRLLANYDQRCCLSGVSTPQLLIASHIVPWSENEEKRLDPRNGLLLNAYLDKAFDKGIISIDAKSFSVIISEKLKDEKALDYFNQYRGIQINLPKNQSVWPAKENLQYHNDVIFNNNEEISMRGYSSFENW